MQESTIKGVFLGEVSADTLSSGTYTEYIALKHFVRADLRIKQLEASNTSIDFTISASFEQAANQALADLDYDDIGLGFYGKATFEDEVEILIDDGTKLVGASALKIVFTVAGGAADSSYSIYSTLVKSGVL